MKDIEEYLRQKKYEGMDERAKARYQRIENQVFDMGYTNKPIYEKSETGYGDYESFFELMVESKLSGDDHFLDMQRVFESMKRQINFYRSELSRAAEDYTKLENKHRNLQIDYNDLLKGR